MAFVGVAELLECVAEAARSVSGPTFGLVVATVGQVILVGHGDGREEETKDQDTQDQKKRKSAKQGCLQSGGLFLNAPRCPATMETWRCISCSGYFAVCYAVCYFGLVICSGCN